MGDIRQITTLRLAVAVSLLLALVNHLLPPKGFAATQLLFDYHFGLIRRGLAGQVLDLFLGPKVTTGDIYMVAAIVTLTGALGFVLFMWRALNGHIGGLMLLILAINAFAFASFVGNTGYLDAILLALALAAMSTNAHSPIGLAARILAAVIGVLVHENMLPYFTVLMGLDLWLAHQRRPVIAALPMLAGAVGVVVILAVMAAFPGDPAAFGTYLQSKAAFVLAAGSVVVAERGIGDNLALMAGLRGTVKYWAWVLFDGVPLLMMSLWLIWLANRVMPQARRMDKALLAAAILAPISLNLIAFDVVRFGVASVLTGFVAVVLVLRHDPDAQHRLTEILTWPHFVLVLVLNANIFTLQVSEGAGHTSQFPWVLVTQLKWLSP